VLKKKKAGFNAPVHDWYSSTILNEHRLFNRRVAQGWMTEMPSLGHSQSGVVR